MESFLRAAITTEVLQPAVDIDGQLAKNLRPKYLAVSDAKLVERRTQGFPTFGAILKVLLHVVCH